MLLLPIRTDRPRIRPAYLTITLIVINTLIHVYGLTLPPVEETVSGLAHPVSMDPLVAQYGLRGSDPTLFTFFSHMFIHGSIMHLVGNMLFLWIFGSLIEDAIRPWGFAAVYFGGGIMAALGHIGMSLAMGHPVDVPMVGASGAIAALMGLFMLRFYKTRVQVFYFFFFFLRGTFWVASIWALLYWIALEVFNGVVASLEDGGGGVAHWAHVGGFVAGAIAAPFLGSITAAQKEYFSDDPGTNVEYVRRNEQVSQAERALRADPGNAYLMRRLAQAYRYAGEYEHATNVYQQSVVRFATRGLMEQATEVYIELLEYNDGAVLPSEVLARLAQALEASRLPLAVWTYQALLARYPVSPEAEHALLRLSGLYSHSLSQPHEALRLLHEFLERYPHSQWAAQARQARDALAGQLRPA